MELFSNILTRITEAVGHPRNHHHVVFTSENTHRVDLFGASDMKSRRPGAALFASAALGCLFGAEVAARHIVQVRTVLIDTPIMVPYLHILWRAHTILVLIL